MKNILIYCTENNTNQDNGIGVKMIDMINNWIKENKLSHIKTKKDFNSFTDDDLNSCDKVIFINPTNDNNIHEFKCHEIKGKPWQLHQLDIRGYEWNDGKLTDNGKLNLEQSFQYLTRKISDWISIRKKLPISFLNK